MELIRLDDVSKTYRMGDLQVPVLKNVSLSVKEGEYVALMGASGSGKSTLMNILGCLDRPSSGSYMLDNEEVADVPSNLRARIRNRMIGFVFQNFSLLPRMSAIDNVTMPLAYTATHLSNRQMRERGEEMLRRLGLEDRMHHAPSQLSGGQQQRVAIARAIVNHPPILLADEPTGNLDSRTSGEVLGIFKDLNEKDGITIIIVTHDEEIASHARRAIHIHDGQIVDGAFAHASHGAAAQ